MTTTADHILIVEDERAVARGLEYGLRQEGFEVLWAETGRRALELVQSSQPDLIVLDVRLPDLNGFDLCRQLRSAGKRQPILMLTARDEEMDKVLGLELGADDYMVKPYSLRELISRVRALLRRAYGELAAGAPTARLNFGPYVLDLERLLLFHDGQPLELTPIEFRLLRHLLSHPERPFSRSQLIEAVWGYDSDIDSERTVDVHIRHLRQKLEVDPAHPRWIVTARGAGYKFQP
ncbi:MAG: DNA-binding response regulator [Chloroflexi bacterium]|nr:MAG: DNA-binding response regulator [Chloroflexota bacterium]